MNETLIQEIMNSLRAISKYCETRKYCTADYSLDGDSDCPFYSFCHKNFHTEPESWLPEDRFKEE